MDNDFPAAHSMDTEWYAVDSQGHVAVFLSDVDGHVPSAARGGDLLRELWEFYHPGAPRQCIDPHIAAPQLGLFFYWYIGNDDPLETYDRQAEPPAPIHVGELPPAFRKQVQEVRFESLTFAETPYIQPLEYFNCVTWGDEALAYLASDGKTVRPIVGKEARFAEFVERFRAEQAERAATMRFEGVALPQKALPPRKTKGDSDGR